MFTFEAEIGARADLQRVSNSDLHVCMIGGWEKVLTTNRQVIAIMIIIGKVVCHVNLFSEDHGKRREGLTRPSQPIL